jgi:hypothetical protein
LITFPDFGFIVCFSESLYSFLPQLTFPFTFLGYVQTLTIDLLTLYVTPISDLSGLLFPLPNYFSNILPAPILKLTFLYYSLQMTTLSQKAQTFFLLHEKTNSFRFQRTTNPIFRYDYKLGNYFTKDDILKTPFLFTTTSEITGGIRKAA